MMFLKAPSISSVLKVSKSDPFQSLQYKVMIPKNVVELMQWQLVTDGISK